MLPIILSVKKQNIYYEHNVISNVWSKFVALILVAIPELYWVIKLYVGFSIYRRVFILEMHFLGVQLSWWWTCTAHH